MVKFVAEVSSNHNQDVQRCLQFVDVAAAIGCDAVKLQLFKIDQMYAPEVLELLPWLAARRQWELPAFYLPAIAKRCEQRNIELACTPFYLEAVDELLPYVDWYKIASYELPWTAMLQRCAQTGKPVVLSTGMATAKEIEQARRVLRTNGCTNLTLLHCTSAYPAPVNECNLNVLDLLNYFDDVKVGWSDHTGNAGVIYRAVHYYNVKMIEFHLDLDATGAEYKIGHCWLPDGAATMIRNVRDGFIADGKEISWRAKQPTPTEQAEVLWRHDPTDGLRPFKSERTREKILARQQQS